MKKSIGLLFRYGLSSENRRATSHTNMTTRKSDGRCAWLLMIFGFIIVYFLSAIAVEVINKRGHISAGSPTHHILRVIYSPFAYIVGAIPGGERAINKLTAKLAGK